MKPVFLSLLFIPLLIPASVPGGKETQHTLLASDGRVSDLFGTGVAISGDVAVVGAYRHDEDRFTTDSGAAYVYRWNSSQWKQEQKLSPIDQRSHTKAGYAVATDGKRIAVGAFGNDRSSGAVYIYRHVGSKWILESKIRPLEARVNDKFGMSVAVRGETLVVGARGTEVGGNAQAGAAYVFTFNGDWWVETQRLVAADPGKGDEFGTRVAFDGETILVGAPLADARGRNSGAAYVFRREEGTWEQAQKLVPGDGSPGDEFAMSVSVSGATIVVGAHQDDVGHEDSGSAYAFSLDQGVWKEARKLVPSDGGLARGDFGYSVSIDGTRIAVGAPADSSPRIRSGSIYLFDHSEGDWSAAGKLSVKGASPNEELGESVAVSRDRVLSGAALDNERGQRSGSAFVFDLDRSGRPNL